VHEHVGERLQQIEIRGLDVMQRTELKHGGAIYAAPYDHHGQPYQEIYYNQILGDRRKSLENILELTHKYDFLAKGINHAVTKLQKSSKKRNFAAIENLMSGYI